jgi:hypothetical protein
LSMVGWMLATLREFAGNLRDLAGPLLDHAGHCRTLRDFAGPCWTMLDHLRGTRGMIGPIAHDRPLHDSKQWAPLWKLGGHAHHYRFFLPDGAGCRWRSLVTWGEGQTSLSKPPRHVIGLSGFLGALNNDESSHSLLGGLHPTCLLQRVLSSS